MTSDRMMQVIGRIERAISRLEAMGDKAALRARLQAQEIDRLKAERAPAPDPRPDEDPLAMDAYSHDKALAALRSLDSLIDELQQARRNG